MLPSCSSMEVSHDKGSDKVGVEDSLYGEGLNGGRESKEKYAG